MSNHRLVEACSSLDADVLALQEIDRAQVRSGGVDQTAAVAAGMGAVAWRFQPALIGEPGATWRAATDGDTGGGDADTGVASAYGVGLVSRLPVRAWHVVRLRAARVRSPVMVPGGRGRFILLPDEPRVAVAAEVETRAGLILVATAHLSFVPGWNVVQLRAVTRDLAGRGMPCVLLGDLNMPGGVPAAVTGWRALAHVRTFPGAKPSLQIDHALGHGMLPVVRRAEARAMGLSDHRAMVLDFI